MWAASPIKLHLLDLIAVLETAPVFKSELTDRA